MAIRLFFLVTTTFLFSEFGYSQNLVPNHSFESLRNLPIKPNPKNAFEYEPLSGYVPYIENMQYWFAATNTTPDLRIGSKKGYSKCDSRFNNCDKAHSGNNCIGIISYMSNRTTDTYREYIQIKLEKPLRPGELTNVEFWVAKERQAKLTSNNLGACFTLQKVKKETLEVLTLRPQINCDTIINKKYKKWTKIIGSFVPTKPYRFLLIGNFFDNKHTDIAEFTNYNGSPYTPPYAYYLIDDVRVWQDTQKEEEKKDSLQFGDELVVSDIPIPLKNIKFEFDRAELKDSSIFELEKLYEFLSLHRNVNILLQGHTDAEGREAYNQKLSEERAKAVYKFLVDKGINNTRLSFKGFGESRPLKENNSKEGRSSNRRVEFVIVQNENN